MPGCSLSTRHGTVAFALLYDIYRLHPVLLMLFITCTIPSTPTMLPQFPLSLLCIAHAAFALALPSSAQVPLLSGQSDVYAKSEHMGVMIAYKRHGENVETTTEFPLRQPLQGTPVQKNSVLPF